MKTGSTIVAILAGVGFCATATSSVADKREPLVVTQMADPDPGYVPSQADRGRYSRASEARDDARIDDVMEKVGRVLGQAALMREQQIEAECRERQPADVPAEQRFAWAATCRYRRH